MSFMQPFIEPFTQHTGDEYEVCQDCLMMIANGDSSGASEDWNPDSMCDANLTPKSLDDFGNEYLNEGSFSWSGCDCCDSMLGGNRYTCVDIDSIQERECYRWRLSAPGYLDCTDWAVADSIEEAIDDCLGMHGDGFDCKDLAKLASYLEGEYEPHSIDFGEMWTGYLYGLAATASDDEGEPLPQFQNPGGDIRDVVEPDDVSKILDDEQRAGCFHDCLAFLLEALPHLPEEFDSWEDLGSDFHLTRNRHGAGFWDGRQGQYGEAGDKLTELAHPYGEFELTAEQS